MTRTRFLLLMWVGLTLLLCVGDHFFHLRTGMLGYRWEPRVDGQSAWVWLVFAVAAAVMLAVTSLFPVRDVPQSVPWGPIVDTASLFVATYALSGQLGATHPTALTIALVVGWVARVLARGKAAPVYAVHGVVLAVLGVVGEGLLSMMGLFDYELQQVLDCPWWLAGLYLHGSIALLEVSRGARALEASV